MKNNKQYEVLWKSVSQKNIAKGVGFRHRKRILKKLVGKFKICGDILDVGCGDGTSFVYFQNDNIKFWGMDNSLEALELAKENYPLAEYLYGDITSRDTLPDRKFNAVFCFDMLEEIYDDEKTLSNINTLLINDGILLISTQHDMKYWTKYDAHAQNKRRYSVAELTSKLKNSGFKIETTYIWGYPLYTAYYKHLLSRVDPDEVWIKDTKKTSLILRLIYYIFFIDDLFVKLNNGRILFVIAKKVKDA